MNARIWHLFIRELQNYRTTGRCSSDCILTDSAKDWQQQRFSLAPVENQTGPRLAQPLSQGAKSVSNKSQRQ